MIIFIPSSTTHALALSVFSSLFFPRYYPYDRTCLLNPRLQQAEEAVEPARLNGAEMEEELAGPAVEERPPEQHQQPEVAAYVDCYADVRVLSQTVLITAFDMERFESVKILVYLAWFAIGHMYTLVAC